MAKSITKEQENYILDHLNDRPRAKVARDAGVSVNTVYRYVRGRGGELDYSRNSRTPEWERIVRENYATMSGHDIERKFGISRNRANKIAKDLGLEHSEETKERIRLNLARALREGRSHIDHTRRVAKWKAKHRIDEMRVWEGKPQRTRFKIRIICGKAYKAKWHLLKRYGYLPIDGSEYEVGYNETTDRRNRSKVWNEDYYVRRYGFKFVGV